MFTKPFIKTIYHQKKGFSLIEIMMATLIVGLIIFGVNTMILDSQKEVDYLQKEASSGEAHKLFALRWSNLIHRATLAPHFQKMPVSFDLPGFKDCTELTEPDQGGGCFFKFKKAIATHKKLPFCPVKSIEIKRQFKERDIKGVNFFKDEDIKMHDKADYPSIIGGTFEYPTIPVIRKKKSKERYYVGWKISKKKPFLLLSKIKDIDFTFSIPRKLGAFNRDCRADSPYTDDKYVLVGRTSLDPSQPSQQDILKNKLELMENQWMVFYVRHYPQIYTLKYIKEIEFCDRDKAEMCMEIINSVLPSDYHISKDHITTQNNYYYIETKKDYAMTYFSNTELYDENIGKDIKWPKATTTYSSPFPLSRFSAIEKIPTDDKTCNDDKYLKNIYITDYLMTSKTEIIGIPVVLNSIKIRNIINSRVKRDSKRQLYNEFFVDDKIGKKRTLINNLRFQYGESAAINPTTSKKRSIESIIIAREIGTRKISVFSVDLDENKRIIDDTETNVCGKNT
ncbi:MAG: prepilin-type N-terminal cleavage/methylation domain-containing protein [Proteobacteria bacterium]|nr:prepilin-type N-terminal cleavage/methylation domain-containing protein [Pseudomonadota bacterium]